MAVLINNQIEVIIMKLKLLVRCFFVLCAFVGFSAYSAEARDCVGEKKLDSTGVMHFGEASTYGVVAADEMDIEFWLRQCSYSSSNGSYYELIATITPTVPGKSKNIAYDVALVQGNEQSSVGAITLDDNLYVSKSYSLGSSNASSTTGIDFSQPVTVMLACEESLRDACNSADFTDKQFTLSAQSGSTTTSSVIKGLTGAWYDPSYNGSGYSVIEAPNGLVIYFYGYKGNADGQAQWLASDVGPVDVTKGQAIQLPIYSGTVGNGGSFTSKPNVGSGISEWGTATVTFNSCNAGTIVLNGQDGQITHNIIKLANVQNLTCTE